MFVKAPFLWSHTSPRSIPCVLISMMAVVVSMSGCGGGGDETSSTPAAGTKSWSIFVYGHADHNLSYSLAADMSEMSNATLGSHMSVIVAADWDSSQMTNGSSGFTPATAGTPYPTGSEWYKIQGGGILPVKLSSGAELDLDDPVVLQAATNFAFQSYPADRYGVILWDHGGSWEGGFGHDSQNGTVTNSSGMTAVEAATAIGNALANRGITGTRPLEFFAFDTCLMACPEVIQPFKDLTKTYIACAEIDFGNGWDYEKTFSFISSKSAIAATEIAAQEVLFWNTHHTTPSDILAKSHVALDMSKWDVFATSMNQLVTSITTSPTLTSIDLGSNQFKSAPGYSFNLENARKQPDLRDAGQLLARLGTVTSDTNVASKALTAQTALNNCRLGLSQGAVRTANVQSGVHIECAIAKTYTDTPGRLTDYAAKASTWMSVSNWQDMLATIQAQDDGTQPVITSTSTGGSSVSVAFSTSESDIGEVSLSIHRINADTTVDDFGLVATDIISPGSYMFDWNLKVATLSAGTVTSFARAERVVIGDGTGNSVFGFPCSYTVGGDTLFGYMILGATDTSTDSFLQVDLSTGTVSVIPLIPGGSIVPLVLRISGAGSVYEPLTPLTVPGNSQFSIGSAAAPAGNYKILIAGMDVWGNEAVIYTVPYALASR